MAKKEEKKKPDTTKTLTSSDMRTARAAINKIRIEGELSNIPGIIEGMRLQEREIIRKEIHNLLCDINIDGAQMYFMEALKDKKNQEISKDLICICWESNLDFTKYVDTFTSAFISGTYETSIEAFTMIEKIFMDYKMPDDKLRKTIQTIRMSYPDLSQNKRELALVLLDGLQNTGNE